MSVDRLRTDRAVVTTHWATLWFDLEAQSALLRIGLN